jgi:hypothetical protein
MHLSHYIVNQMSKALLGDRGETDLHIESCLDFGNGSERSRAPCLSNEFETMKHVVEPARGKR